MAYGKTLSREIAHHGITVNTILTGGVQTERTMQLRKIRAQKEGISYEEVVRQGSKNFPVGYIATPEQFSQAVVFLASPLSEYINGVSFPIDGGAMRSM
jgi:3-oxoacyl-[acyl-carrier protein] reductase